MQDQNIGWWNTVKWMNHNDVTSTRAFKKENQSWFDFNPEFIPQLRILYLFSTGFNTYKINRTQRTTENFFWNFGFGFFFFFSFPFFSFCFWPTKILTMMMMNDGWTNGSFHYNPIVGEKIDTVDIYYNKSIHCCNNHPSSNLPLRDQRL